MARGSMVGSNKRQVDRLSTIYNRHMMKAKVSKSKRRLTTTNQKFIPKPSTPYDPNTIMNKLTIKFASLYNRIQKINAKEEIQRKSEDELKAEEKKYQKVIQRCYVKIHGVTFRVGPDINYREEKKKEVESQCPIM